MTVAFEWLGVCSMSRRAHAAPQRSLGKMFSSLSKPGSVLATLHQPRASRSLEHPVSWLSAVAALALLGGGLCRIILGAWMGLGTAEPMQVAGMLGGLLTALSSRVAGDLRARSAANSPLAPVPEPE
jgi:hypothetical protein